MIHRIVAGTWRKHHQSGHDFSRPCLFFFRPRNFSSNSLLLLDKKETEHYFLVRRNYNKFLLKFRRAISLSSINLGFRGYYSIGLMSLLKSIHQWNLDRYSILFIYYTKISSKEILYTTLKALVLQHFEIDFDTFFSIIFFFQRIKKSTNYQPHLNITGNKFLTLKIQYDTSSKKKKELYPQTFPTRSNLTRSRSLFIPFSRVATESWCSRVSRRKGCGGRRQGYRAGHGIDLSSRQTDTGSNYRRLELAVFLRPTRGICSRSRSPTLDLPRLIFLRAFLLLIELSPRGESKLLGGVCLAEGFFSTLVTIILIGRWMAAWRLENRWEPIKGKNYAGRELGRIKR